MPDEHSIAKRRAVVLAPQLLEAGDLDLALGQLDGLPRPRQRVRALAADLDRAVAGGRWRITPVGSANGSAGVRPGARSPSMSPVVEVHPSCATVS